MTEHQEHEQDQEPQDPPTEVATTSSSNAFDAIDDYMNSTEEETPSMPPSHEASTSDRSLSEANLSEADGDFRNVAPSPEHAAVFQGAGSLALSQLPKELRPSPPTVCQVCPGSLWTGSPRDAQCWCRIMHFTSWSSNAPYQRIACDGIAIAEQMAGE
jgi:hypothetical protein